MSDAPGSLAEALAALQGRMPRIAKAGHGDVYKDGKFQFGYDYAKLEDITAQLYPVMAELGLSFSARPTIRNKTGQFALRYVLRHVSGEKDRGWYPLPDPARYGPQDLGKAITYARRYSLCSITGLAPGGDDNDAQDLADATVTAEPARLSRNIPDADLAAAGRMTRAQAAAHDKLKADTLKGSRRAERSRPESPDADPWAVDEPMTSERAARLRSTLDAARSDLPEDAPGSIGPGQKRALELLLTKLGIDHGDRVQRHSVLANLIMPGGQDLPPDPDGDPGRPSVNGLSYLQAGQALKLLGDQLAETKRATHG